MNREIQNFESLVDKYKFVQPVPEDIQVYAVKARKDIIRVLKAAGAYTLLGGMVIRVYFLLRGMGIGAAFTTVKAGLIVAAAGLSVAGAGGAYIALQQVVEPQDVPAGEIISPSPVIVDEVKDTAARPEQRYSIAVYDFQGPAGVAGTLTEQFRMALQEEVKRLSPAGVLSRNGRITGSVHETDEGLYITVKLIDAETSKILTVEAGQTDREHLDSLVAEMAGKIVSRLR